MNVFIESFFKEGIDVEIIRIMFVLILVHLMSMYMWSLTIGQMYGYFCGTNFIDLRIPMVISCLILDIIVSVMHPIFIPISLLFTLSLFYIGFFIEKRYHCTKEFKDRGYDYQIKELYLSRFRDYDKPKSTFDAEVYHNGKIATVYFRYFGDFDSMEVTCYDDNTITKEVILPFLDIEMKHHIAKTHQKMLNKWTVIGRKVLFGLPHPDH